MTERFELKNRSGLKLVGIIDHPANPSGLVFIAHGQGGFKEQTHIKAFTDAFLQNNFTVVRFDATHSLGESEGDIIDVTYDSYVHDLEDAIRWAKQQSWFQSPFALCGHSMGAQSAVWYAEHHPGEVKLLAPMAPTVNQELYISTLDDEYMRTWKENGYKELVSKSKPGVVKRVGWGVVQSLSKYDILPKADMLTMPLFMAVGEFDEPCPVKHQEQFMSAIPSASKRLVVVKGADHNYRDASTGEYKENLEIIKNELSNWIKSLTK